jgi:hypothetical protein
MPLPYPQKARYRAMADTIKPLIDQIVESKKGQNVKYRIAQVITGF